MTPESLHYVCSVLKPGAYRVSCSWWKWEVFFRVYRLYTWNSKKKKLLSGVLTVALLPFAGVTNGSFSPSKFWPCSPAGPSLRSQVNLDIAVVWGNWMDLVSMCTWDTHMWGSHRACVMEGPACWCSEHDSPQDSSITVQLPSSACISSDYLTHNLHLSETVTHSKQTGQKLKFVHM